MQTFLNELAQNLLTKHNTDLSEICVVLPNRRASLYLKKELSEEAGKTIWSPDIFSLEDLLTQVSGFKKLDAVALIFELFEIHKLIEKENVQEFDKFVKWGQIMLSDFNEIDMHLVDAAKLFGYLSEVKAIEKWNPGGSSLTASERNYLAFYKSLFNYYTLLRENLMQKNEAYQGMIYRFAAGNTDQLLEKTRWKKIYFAGFNALTRSEEKVIALLQINGKAETIWDADAYYLNDEKQEAGYFLRRKREKEGSAKFGPVGEHFKNSAKKIYIHGVPRKAGQATLAGKILQNWKDKDSPDKNATTAVVLADENLLIPLMNELPANLGTFNVTMGYPLRLTLIFNFTLQIFRLFENVSRFQNVGTHSEGAFYFRDILRVLQHSALAEIVDSTRQIAEINRSKQVFYKPKELIELFSGKQTEKANQACPPIIKAIFENHDPDSDRLLNMVDEIIAIFRNHFTKPKTKPAKDVEPGLQMEYLYHLSLLTKRLKELNNSYKSLSSLHTLREIFALLTAGLRLPFSGEPLQGTQIMGMLETRNLDFENIILVSANEGILPTSPSGNSFIPYDIQIEFDLPTHNQKTAVFAYHFYRLIQRAKKVHILYNTEADELGGGDKSRFLHQILAELRVYNPDLEIVENVESLTSPEKNSERIIEIAKDKLVFDKLLEKAGRGLSPTSLNQYRRCPLQFYFQNIAGIKETDEVEENIEHRTIGSIVHKVLEELYKPFKNMNITSPDIAAMPAKVEPLMEAAFEELYNKGQVKFGRNRLIFEVIKNFIHAFLTYEKSEVQQLEKNNGELRIIDLEQKLWGEEYSCTLPARNNIEIKFRGTIDRVDELNGTTRIIDYKTGQIKSSTDLQIKDWADFDEGEKKDKAFQVLIYSWLYNKNENNKCNALESGIIGLRNLSNGLMSFGIKPERNSTPDQLIDEEKLEKFEQYLVSLLNKMFDESTPFSQTDKPETCRICDYKDVCNR